MEQHLSIGQRLVIIMGAATVCWAVIAAPAVLIWNTVGGFN